uniref:N6-adenosine-methyltransferase MT-A70-like n=1 Tax=Kalanchoe fedtschenkoi TaxID=63787 RepID=A0A7N0UMN4_KALFE
MATQSGGNLEEPSMARIKEMRHQLESRIEAQHTTQMDLLASLHTQIPNIVSSVDLSMKVVSFFNNTPFTPTPIPPPNPNPNRNLNALKKHRRLSSPERRDFLDNGGNRGSGNLVDLGAERDKGLRDYSGSPLNVVRSLVAVCLLQRVPFVPIDSSTVLRKLENDPNVTAAEKAALRELGGESGGILAVEMALRSMVEENGGVELEEFVVSKNSRVMVLGIDRTKLVRELPESSQLQDLNSFDDNKSQLAGAGGADFNGGIFGVGSSPGSRHMQEMWDPHMSPMFQAYGNPGSMMFPRGGPRGMSPMMMGVGRGMGMSPLSRPPLGPNSVLSAMPPKIRSEEDDLKDLEALLSKKSFKEQQKSKTGEELLDLIHRPTAKETAVAAKFKTKGGSQLKEYCTALTKEDCRRQNGSYIACEKVHFRRIIALHTDMNLGDCSFLDTCRHMKTCKYVHYELDPTPDLPSMMTGAGTLSVPKPLKPQRAEYCSEVELGESQWINCDIRNFRMDILGQFGVIMADPPWDIHMELPYGTMADDEMKNLNVPALQTDGLIFLWVTGRAMELGRDCLELWGYKRVEEIIWVKTNQLQRIIRTGRTGHWLNHSKEHCLVGIKGNPEVNRNIDTDVIVAEVRETSRKPDEMYPLLERISPRTRKLELFARMHNTHAGWMSLGNQLSGVRLVDEGLRARFKAAYPDVEVEPASPPRASVIEVDSAPQMRSPFSGGMDSKPMSAQFSDAAAPDSSFASQTKLMNADSDMVS